MGAVQFQEANSPAAITKHDKILPHDAQPSRQVLQFLCEDNGLPETP
jgi:hypothetical protein